MDEERLSDEGGRLAALRRLAILDTGREAEYEHITSLARTVLDVPVAAVSLIESDRQWFKAVDGLDLCETSREKSFCSVAIERREPLIVENALEEPRFCANPLVTGEPFIRSYVGVPLVLLDGFQVGALCGIDVRPRSFSPHQVAALRNLALCVEKEFELRLEARRDDLTGFQSRAAFFGTLETTLRQVVAGQGTAALAVVDLDHFKSVNDTRGHEAGDCVLRQVAGLCLERLGHEACLGRIGGEEFGIVFPGATVGAVAETIEALRRSIETLSIPGHPGLRVTISAGVSDLRGAQGDAVDAFKRADAALYAAKAQGRNRVRIADGQSVPQTCRSLPHLWRINARSACKDAVDAASDRGDLAAVYG